MDVRPAVVQDLPQLQTVYKQIIANRNRNQIQIWDAVYPCEVFQEDIKSNRLFVLTSKDEIIAAFSLWNAHAGAYAMNWKNSQAEAWYLDRLGVHVDHTRKGIGSFMLQKAMELARTSGIAYLRLFVVDTNAPAIHLYMKNGFTKGKGSYDEVIDNDRILHMLGYEAELSL